MSYVGKSPDYTHLPSQFFNGDGTAMTVTLDYAPYSYAALLVFIHGIKVPLTDYTVSGLSLTFTNTVISGTNNVQVIYLGFSLDQGDIGDDTVTIGKFNSTGTPTAYNYLRGDMSWNNASAASGGSGEEIFFNNDTEINYDYVVPSGYNSVSAGPINIASGVTVTVAPGSNWTIV
jgi:hypothetical protein